jgi:membrane protein required for colicin V production
MEQISFNVLDVVIVAVVALSALIGLLRGFVSEVLSLAAWGGAAWLTLTFYERGRKLAGSLIDDPFFAGAAAALVIFVATLVTFLLIAGFLARGVRRASMLGPADRTLGLLFGVARGVVVAALGYILTLHLLDARDEREEEPPRDERETPEWVETSRLLPHIRAAASLLERLVPPDALPRAPQEPEDGQTQTETDTRGETGYTAGSAADTEPAREATGGVRPT